MLLFYLKVLTTNLSLYNLVSVNSSQSQQSSSSIGLLSSVLDDAPLSKSVTYISIFITAFSKSSSESLRYPHPNHAISDPPFFTHVSNMSSCSPSLFIHRVINFRQQNSNLIKEIYKKIALGVRGQGQMTEMTASF